MAYRTEAFQRNVVWLLAKMELLVIICEREHIYTWQVVTKLICDVWETGWHCCSPWFRHVTSSLSFCFNSKRHWFYSSTVLRKALKYWKCLKSKKNVSFLALLLRPKYFLQVQENWYDLQPAFYSQIVQLGVLWKRNSC